MTVTDDKIVQRFAGDVMPGDCCRIDGCWETVYMAGHVGISGGEVALFTEGGQHIFNSNALVTTLAEE